VNRLGFRLVANHILGKAFESFGAKAISRKAKEMNCSKHVAPCAKIRLLGFRVMGLDIMTYIELGLYPKYSNLISGCCLLQVERIINNGPNIFPLISQSS